MTAVMLFQLLQNPIVVEVVKQPPVTPEISYGSVLLAAVSLLGVITLASATVGITIGAVIIWRKKRDAALHPTADHSHVKLQISSPNAGKGGR